MSKNLVHLISQGEIVRTVKRLAGELNRDYQDRSLVLVGILKGSFMFLADLVRDTTWKVIGLNHLRE